MKQLRAVWRLLRLVGHIAQGLWVVALRFPTLSPDQQHARVQVWSQQLLALAGVHLRVVGQPPLTGPVMLVANHISWLHRSGHAVYRAQFAPRCLAHGAVHARGAGAR